MTERLYYTDSYTTEFESKIVAVTSISEESITAKSSAGDSGDGAVARERPAIELAATYFYPTSGGQAFDSGTLGEWRVTDVLVEKDGPGSLGRVLHVLDAEASMLSSRVAAGEVIRGVVDWPRRYDHMQQHSGQHLLSHAFFHLFGYETVSVHFGADESTLDLAVDALGDDALSDDTLRVVERYVNEVVYSNLPVRAYFVDESAIGDLPLRRPPKVTGEIRVVEIDGIDYSACGGTHCRATGELGPIKLLRVEKSRKNMRVAFVCGWRSHADYAQKHRLLLDSAHLFSTDLTQVPFSIKRLLEQNKMLSRRLSRQTEELLVVEAAQAVGSARSIGEYRLVAQVFADREIDEVKKLASLLQEQRDLIVLFGVCKADQLTAIFARGETVPVEMGELLRKTLGKFGGGGGGRPDFAQGGKVNAAQAQAVLDSAILTLKSMLLSR